MKFGCFCFASQIPVIKSVGFDSAELDISEIMRMSDQEYDEFKRRAMDVGLGYEVFSGLIPLTERIYSEAFEIEYWIDYAKRVAERIKALGAVMVPFGAGKCRSIPDDCKDVMFVKNKVLELVRGISDVFNNYGISFVIEPLGKAYSNYINTIGEAVEFVKTVERDNCMVMCDLRHMYSLGEGMDDIIKYREYILHAHIDYPKGSYRYFPKSYDGFDYQPYLNALKGAGYKGLITIEATEFNDLQSEASEALKLLKFFCI